MKTSRKEIAYRVGAWLPSDQKHLEVWLEELILYIEGLEEMTFHPVIQEFIELIETDPEIFMLMNMALNQVPAKYRESEYGPQIRDYFQLMKMFNVILTQAPTFNETGCMGFPFNAILDWSMGTEGGFALYLNKKFNKQLQKMLTEWGHFLKSPDSCYVLDGNYEHREGHGKLTHIHWFTEAALMAMFPDSLNYTEAEENFGNTYQCDLNAKHWGFKSWDDFFTREFNKGVRPVGGEGDENIIANACESAPYRLSKGVMQLDTFWIKGQNYSLQHMLDNHKNMERFIGGTVYQAFLSALSYHRWHAPVSGTIVDVVQVEGTYYSEIPANGFYNPLHTGVNDQNPDSAGPNDSQGYITEVARRVLIFIEADNPKIGLMCFMAVGMAEVSSCDVTVYEGQHVTKGEQLGMFHFGGSTHCLIFRPEVKLEFSNYINDHAGLDSSNINVKSEIAKVI